MKENKKKKLVVFTDLDGTLLDHFSYSWRDAQPALNALRENECPVIINSSKTRSEIQGLRTELDNRDPFIVENGSAVIIPDHYFQGQKTDVTIKRFGPPREDILKSLAALREQHAYDFVGFNDMSAMKVAKITGLDMASAEKAKQRDSSEPLLWNDTETRLNGFIEQLKLEGYSVVVGGRFLHVMGAVSKADSIGWLMNTYESQYPEHELMSVGLGDSGNDIPMLETVDIPVLVSGMHDQKIEVKREDLIRTKAKGPKGWNQVMLELIEKLRESNE